MNFKAHGELTTQNTYWFLVGKNGIKSHILYPLYSLFSYSLLSPSKKWQPYLVIIQEVLLVRIKVLTPYDLRKADSIRIRIPRRLDRATTSWRPFDSRGCLVSGFAQSQESEETKQRAFSTQTIFAGRLAYYLSRERPLSQEPRRDVLGSAILGGQTLLSVPAGRLTRDRFPLAQDLKFGIGDGYLCLAQLFTFRLHAGIFE